MYACYPGARNPATMVSQRHLYRAYIPIYNALGAAGWEPVPYAHVITNATGEKMHPWCERFGHGVGGYFFTVRNPGQAAELTLAFSADELHRLHLEKPQFTAVTGCQIKSAAADRIVLAVPATWTAVIAINREDATRLAEVNGDEMKQQP